MAPSTFSVETRTIAGEVTAAGSVALRGTELEALVTEVDRIAEIPNSLRLGTQVRLGEVRVR